MDVRIGVWTVAQTLSKVGRKMGLARATRDELSQSPPDGTVAGDSDTSRHKPLPFAWTLFTAVWLLFPAGFVVQALRSDFSPVQLVALLTSLAAFISIFLWLMLQYPFPVADLTPRELRVRLGLLLVMSVLALYVELLYVDLVYGSGVPYRFVYVVIAAAVTLPTRKAAWTVAVITVVAGLVYAVQVGWEVFATSWQELVPFPLIGIGMIAVSRLVITVRELQAARREIAQLAAAEAVARERLRFARDLHDLLGHSLSSITLKSELAGRLLPAAPEKAAAEVRDIEIVARRSLREVREAVSGYRQPALDEELNGAREMLHAAGIVCRIENEVSDLPNAMDTVLAWTVREGVTNVIRHSRADRCEIQITRDGEKIYAEVKDDGYGSPPEYEEFRAGGSGLSGLAERVAASGGYFEAAALPEGGFRLRVSLPARSVSEEGRQ
jgi:two-component system sensor histidine kinase DesK